MITPCKNYTGAKTPYGYGKQKYQGKQTLAHRVAYTKAFGEIPKSLCVLHKCDNPSCVNINHLFLGTHKDNMADMFSKGRGNRAAGERNGSVKLTKKEVLEIRASNLRYPILAKLFGVSVANISLIKTHKTWRLTI